MPKKSTSYFTYIVKCSDGTYYTGLTSNLQKRLIQHNGKKAGGAKYTRIRRPVTLLYYEVFPTRSEALRRELAIKKITKKAKELLCHLG